MAFFDKIGEMAKNIGDKTGDAIETTKLNNKIKAEHLAAAEDFKKIGEHYYNLFVAGFEVVPEVLEFCQSAKAHFDAADQAQAEIDGIKTQNEAEKLAAAQAQNTSAVPAEAASVVSAIPAEAAPEASTIPTEVISEASATPTAVSMAAPVAPSGIICPSCSTVNNEGTKFCQNCGTKLITEPPKECKCSSCGAVITPDMRFCSECGHRVEE